MNCVFLILALITAALTATFFFTDHPYLSAYCFAGFLGVILYWRAATTAPVDPEDEQ